MTRDQIDDPAQSLVFLNNRSYNPSTGIFTSVDPLVVISGDPYLYAGANPSTHSDPTGLLTDCVCGSPVPPPATPPTPTTTSEGGGGDSSGTGPPAPVPPPEPTSTRVCTQPRTLLCNDSRYRHPGGSWLDIVDGKLEGYFTLRILGGFYRIGDRSFNTETLDWTLDVGWVGGDSWIRTDRIESGVVSVFYHYRGESGDMIEFEMARWVGDVEISYIGSVITITPEVPAAPKSPGDLGPSLSSDEIPFIPDLTRSWAFGDGRVVAVNLGDGVPLPLDSSYVTGENVIYLNDVGE